MNQEVSTTSAMNHTVAPLYPLRQRKNSFFLKLGITQVQTNSSDFFTTENTLIDRGPLSSRWLVDGTLLNNYIKNIAIIHILPQRGSRMSWFRKPMASSPKTLHSQSFSLNMWGSQCHWSALSILHRTPF